MSDNQQREILTVEGVGIAGIAACLPRNCVDNLERCGALLGSAEKAAGVVKTTGIAHCRVANEGTSSLDLGVAAAQQVLKDTHTSADTIGALIFVTFTPERAMPANACQSQARLGLGHDIMAFDISMACSGWIYGLYVASLLVRATGRKVLLLDADVQSARLAENDAATIPVLADAGTATLLEPVASGEAWRFAFMTKGEGGEALRLPVGGSIAMDGFAVFKFVAADVVRFIRDFLQKNGRNAADYEAFVPHQANVYMIRQLAKSLGFVDSALWVSADRFGNSASASVPVTIASTGGLSPVAGGLSPVVRRLLVAGFGGGLSAGVAEISLAATARLSLIES